MAQAADFTVQTDDQGDLFVLSGAWTAVGLNRAGVRLEQALRRSPSARLDLTGVSRCDTAGALAVLTAFDQTDRTGRVHATPDVLHLIELVSAARPGPIPRPPRHNAFVALLDRMGRAVIDIGDNLFDMMAFNGQLLLCIVRAVRNPGTVRWTAAFALAERAGLDAMPIVAMTTFFIGAVVGLVGANLLRQFGAQVFAVELIGIAILREFNVLITALLLAGRSSSAFAAEIGSMKMNQEVDAMKVLGIDPFDALVLPRFLALLLTIPLLVFVATLAGLAGGLAVTTFVLDLSPTVFFQRMIDNVGVTNFWVGLSKSPVMAVVIAAIGCRQGLDVGGDVESLGRHVTSSVVQAIFAAILIDAVFAVIFMKLNV